MQNVHSEQLEIDSQRISRIRVQLDDNSYIVNTRQIADKVIAIEIALCEPIIMTSMLAQNV